MRIIAGLILNVFFMAGSVFAQSDASHSLSVIVNANSPITTLTRKEVADLYLGRTRSLGSMKQVIALDHAMSSPLRALFYKDLTGKDIAEINSYWARLLFTGQNSPPQSMPDADTMLDMVRKNLTAVGYLSHVPEDKSIRVVLVLEGKP